MAPPQRRRQPDTIRATTLDVQHSNRRSAVVVGPVRLPPRDELTTRILSMAAVGPETRVGLQPSSSATRWRYSPESARAAVSDTVLSAGADPVTLVATLRQRPDSGIRVLTAGDYLAIDFSHGLGEIPLLHTVIDVLFGNVDPADHSRWGRYRRSVPPLLAAGVRAIGVEPHRLLPLWRQHRRNTTTPAQTDAHNGGDAVPSPATRVSRIAAAEVAELRAQRDWSSPGVSLFAIYTHALYRAFIAAGFDVDRTVTIPFDVRRFLPGGHDTLASFSAGLDFTLDPRAGPARLNDQMTEANSMARPVANLIAGTLATRAAIRSAKVNDWTVPARPRLRLLHSSVGSVPRSGRWPFTDPSEARVLVASDPAGPCGMTVTTSTVTGALWLTAEFHGSVFDAARVGAALDSVAAQARSLIRPPAPEKRSAR